MLGREAHPSPLGTGVDIRIHGPKNVNKSSKNENKYYYDKSRREDSEGKDQVH
jgi:hypothetical protein